MKSNFRIKVAAVCLLCLGAISVKAQAPEKLPIDPQVRYGKLDNGLTYYIRHNEEPKDRAEFHIAQAVGSVLEEENQRGLAHFLEHMAFNGTKNFPGKGILNYLETYGVKFGYNINAGTGIDQTVYYLSDVPSTNANLVDSCLLVLHDWSGFISLEDKEIDDERGVIHEEWRTRSNPYLRMYENVILPEVYPGNRYGQRLPIGLMEVVDNFKYQALRDYYHKWYRTDLQAVIVIGDIDVDKIEARIKEMWKDIPAPVNPAPRTQFEIEDNEQPIIAIASDKEAPVNMIDICFKQDVTPMEYRGTAPDYSMGYVNSAITSMLNDRYSEITNKADAPFTGASVDYGNFFVSQTKDALELSMTFRENEWQKGLDKLIAVLNSAKDYGFTPAEYERFKAEYLSSMENYYNERDKQKSSAYAKEYTRHFLKGEPIPGVEVEYQLAQMLVKQIPVEAINQVLNQYITPKNIVIMMMGVEKEGVKMPSKDELLAAFNKAVAEPSVAYEETVSNEPLITNLPAAGKIQTEKAGELGFTEWTLSNGARVIFKQTDFKKDQIMMRAVSKGGKSLLPEQDKVLSKMLDDLIGLGGVGAFSATDLPKVLAGKRATVSPSIGDHSESLTGTSTPKDLETMMQLTYLYFTAPRADEEAFASYRQRNISILENATKTPQYAMIDSLNSTLYNHDAAHRPLSLSDIESADYNRAMKIYKERFANAGDFTFVFVGNIDVATFKPMVEQYIASLPSDKSRENYKPALPLVTLGQKENRFSTEMATPKVTIYNVLKMEKPYSLQTKFVSSFFEQIMDMVYTETIREEEGGTYGVQTYDQVSIIPEEKEVFFLYGFDTGEEKQTRLEARCFDEIKKIANEGPDAAKFNKVKEFIAKQHAQNMKENSYWVGAMQEKVLYGVDRVSDYDKTLESITPEMVKAFAGELVNSGNRVQVVCTGVAQK